MRKLLFTFTTCTLAAVVWGSSGLAKASLVARNLDANAATAEAYYDTSLNITWLRDSQHLAFVTPGMQSNGLVSWTDGAGAIAALNANSAANFGLSGWRMPTANGVATIGGAGCQFGFNGSTDCGSNVNNASSELAYMFQVNLGNLSQRDTSGSVRAGSAGIDFGLVNEGDFTGLTAGRYWSGTDSFRLIFSSPLNGKVAFDFNDGSQSVFASTAGSLGHVWLVHDGDVGAAVTSQPLPEPGSLALFAVAGLAAALQRRRCGARGPLLRSAASDQAAR